MSALFSESRGLPRPSRGPSRRPLRRAALALAAGALLAAPLAPAGASGVPASAAPAASTPVAASGGNPVTPGDFTGYGFDQCVTQNQKTMNRWLHHSPFLAVGIYISGDSRACRSQPNLDATWVRKQLKKGWRLLPITLGPQASCQPRFPRYSDDFTISPKPGKNNRYQRAWNMGVAEAGKTVSAARGLGIVPRSTLFYDLEGFDLGNRHCRESALVFLSGWTAKIHATNYVSGVYSSASSGIKMLDDARVQRPGKFHLPDQIWIARWDERANTSTSYIRSAGWQPGGRLKQYRGGHDEVWGGVRINIDSNYLRLGRGSVRPSEKRCGGVRVGFRSLPILKPGDSSGKVRALQCLLKEKGLYRGRLHGTYDGATVSAARAWQAKRSLRPSDKWNRRHWATLYAAGRRPALKTGSYGHDVLRVQRALNGVNPKARLRSTGVFDKPTAAAVRAYQSRVRVRTSGVVNYATWKRLAAGVR